jgi:L-rhamnose isomerase
MSVRKYASGTAVFSKCPDRFVPVGYHESLGIGDILQRMSKIEKLKGVELGWPGDFPEGSGNKMKKLADSFNMEIVIVEIDTSTNPKYKFGMLTDPDKKVRRQCMDYMKKGVEETISTGCKKINLWLGQEGYDYPLQVDYMLNWNNLREGISELAGSFKDVTFCLEPKMKEPRTHCHVATVGKALLLALDSKLDNVGVNIDTGHALAAYENMAESIVLLSLYKKLFHLHVNDNYRYWDDDMAVGSVNLWETLELFYWLDEVGYDGWLSLDVFPYRESWEQICIQSIENMELMAGIVSQLDKTKIKEILAENDSMKMVAFLRENVLKRAF